MGHTPSTAGIFRKKFRKNSGKTPETLSKRFLEFPSRVRLGCPKPCNSRHLRLSEHFQNSLPPSTAGGRLFFQNWFRRGPLRAGHGIPSSTEGISDFALSYAAKTLDRGCKKRVVGRQGFGVRGTRHCRHFRCFQGSETDLHSPFSPFSSKPLFAVLRKRAEYCFESTVSEKRTH